MDTKAAEERVLPDDIDCYEWLDEINMEQYVETFLANFTYGGRFLSRKRLGQVRMKDFPKMNITNYDHQKILFQHINYTLKHEYSNPQRRRQSAILSPMKSPNPRVGDRKMEDLKGEQDANEAKWSADAEDASSAEPKSYNPPVLKKQNTKPDIKPEKKKITLRKRNSFDQQAWDSINRLRGVGKGSTDSLRDQVVEIADAKATDKPKKQFRRRSTFDGMENADNSKKGKAYGNMALQFNTMQAKMLAYQQGHLTEIRDTIGCELVHILFFNDQSRELMMCADEKWFRIPCESGIEGWCIVTGETINLDDAYRDHRFNENMDRVTGVKTRNILCSPLRANRGGGRVVAVLNLINKKGGSNFDDNDEIIVHQMANNFIDEMAAEFGDLLSLNDSISSFATPILPSDGRRPSFSHEGHTTATSNYRNMVETTKKYLEERKGVESGFKIGSNDSQSQEKEKSKRERRRSFGEKLNQEIAENPELLHVRKN